MSFGKRNRSVGHQTERLLATKFREIGFPHVVTSRSESRSRDNDKVDLINKNEAVVGRLPYNVQSKNSVKPVKYALLLDELPKIEGITNVVVHRQTVKTGNRFMTKDDFAILYLDDFFKLIKKLKEYETTRSSN